MVYKNKLKILAQLMKFFLANGINQVQNNIVPTIDFVLSLTSVLLIRNSGSWNILWTGEGFTDELICRPY